MKYEFYLFPLYVYRVMCEVSSFPFTRKYHILWCQCDSVSTENALFS